MPTEPVSLSWRRFLRFSLRGLIVLVLVIGVWVGWIVRSARIQRAAVAVITQAGGRVAYDWEKSSNAVGFSGAGPWAPRWLVDLIGVDYFGHVTEAGFDPTCVPDEVLAQVGRLRQVEELYLNRTSVSDAGLCNLRG